MFRQPRPADIGEPCHFLEMRLERGRKRGTHTSARAIYHAHAPALDGPHRRQHPQLAQPLVRTFRQVEARWIGAVDDVEVVVAGNDQHAFGEARMTRDGVQELGPLARPARIGHVAAHHDGVERVARMQHLASRIAGQKPVSAIASLLESLPNQIATTIGAIPSVNAGTATRRVKATASFGRLISASRLPASDSSERRLELEASSSISPRRGSMAGLKQLLLRRATAPAHSRTTSAAALREYTHFAAIAQASSALPRPVPSPRMKRLRMSAGSRTVCPIPGLSSIFAASSTGPPSPKRRDTSCSKWRSSRTHWLLAMPAPRAIATMSALLAVAAACLPVIW